MKSQKRIAVLIGIIMIWSVLLTACGQQQNQNTTAPANGKEPGTDKTAKLTIYTSFYPLYDFTVKIAGERANVTTLVPPGTEPHDFEPTARDLLGLSKANIFIYNGSGFEVWLEKVLQAIDTSQMIVVNASEHAQLIADDPHIWLDPLNSIEIARAIKDALIQADSAGKTFYESNFQQLAANLAQLHAEYQEVAARAGRKEIIVSHAAFGYLANRYGLKQIAISGLSPADEPSRKELQEIITLANEHDVKYILFETLVSGKVAEAVREQIGAEALPFNPLEGLTKEELAGGKDYFSVMRDNLESLQKALGVTMP